MKTRRLALAVLAWLAAAGLLWFAVREMPFAAMFALLARLSPGQILALIVVNGLILLLMALRWSLVLRALGGYAPLLSIAAYRMAGQGVSYFTPGPQFGGEPVQVHLLQRRNGVPLSLAVSSVLLDRLVDLLMNFTFLAVGVVIVAMAGFAGPSGGEAFALPMLLIFFPLAHLAALAFGKRPAGALLAWAGRRSPRARAAAGVVLRSEENIACFLRDRPRGFAAVIALSGVNWLMMVFEFWLMVAFLHRPVTLLESISAQTAARLAFLLPLPAGLGALEASQVMAAEMLGWGPAVGLALSLLIRARDVVVGLLGLWVGGAAYQSVLASKNKTRKNFEPENGVEKEAGK